MKIAIARYFESGRHSSEYEIIKELYEEYINSAIFPVSIKEISSKKGPIVISVVRNEVGIIRDFIDHYRRIGISRFVIIDNRSTDGTLEYLSRQADVDLYRTEADFTTVRKQAWISTLLDLYGRDGQWFVCVDADEQIVFDGMESGRDLSDLAAAMERAGIRRVRGCLVDMYCERPLGHSSLGHPCDEARALVERYPFFDAAGYEEYALPFLIAREGGPRQRLFRSSADSFRPQLSKYPMFRIGPGELFINPHFLWPYELNFESDCFLGILHFKFLPGFAEKIDTAIAEGGYWENSLEYRCYKSIMSGNGHLTFIGENTERYGGAYSLVLCNLIASIPW